MDPRTKNVELRTYLEIWNLKLGAWNLNLNPEPGTGSRCIFGVIYQA